MTAQAWASLMEGLLRERTEWDELPEFGLVLDRDGGVSTLPVVVEAKTWSGRHPAEVIDGLTAIGDPPSQIVGAYVRREGFMPPPTLAGLAGDAAEYGADVPSFASLPDRIEVRLCSVVDLDGGSCTVVQRRDTGQFVTSDATEGRIPEALREALGRLVAPQEARAVAIRYGEHEAKARYVLASAAEPLRIVQASLHAGLVEGPDWVALAMVGPGAGAIAAALASALAEFQAGRDLGWQVVNVELTDLWEDGGDV